MNRLGSLLLAILAALPTLACEAPVTAAVVKDILRVKDRGDVVFVKQTRGVLRPPVAELTAELRSTVIAEEIVADFESRNARSVELDAENAIDLNAYAGAAGVDWVRLDRDFPGTDAVIELSRPGCDSQSAFAIVQARYRLRQERFPDEGRLFHLEKLTNGTWRVQRMVVATAEMFAQ
ncbi:MAG TPA: hypothetical protein VGF28_12970 [Thermoanaerobaculia bacterium]